MFATGIGANVVGEKNDDPLVVVVGGSGDDDDDDTIEEVVDVVATVIVVVGEFVDEAKLTAADVVLWASARKPQR